jgi:hypothetical protein
MQRNHHFLSLISKELPVKNFLFQSQIGITFSSGIGFQFAQPVFTNSEKKGFDVFNSSLKNDYQL